LAKITTGNNFETIISHFKELATNSTYPNSEQQHTRDLLFKLVDEIESVTSAEAILQAHESDLNSDTNRDRILKLAKQYEELRATAITAFKSATKAGAKKYSLTGNIHRYKNSKSDTRKESRQRLYELADECDADQLEVIIDHFQELATADSYPDDEQADAVAKFCRLANKLDEDYLTEILDTREHELHEAVVRTLPELVESRPAIEALSTHTKGLAAIVRNEEHDIEHRILAISIQGSSLQSNSATSTEVGAENNCFIDILTNSAEANGLRVAVAELQSVIADNGGTATLESHLPEILEIATDFEEQDDVRIPAAETLISLVESDQGIAKIEAASEQITTTIVDQSTTTKLRETMAKLLLALPDAKLGSIVTPALPTLIGIVVADDESETLRENIRSLLARTAAKDASVFFDSHEWSDRPVQKLASMHEDIDAMAHTGAIFGKLVGQTDRELRTPYIKEMVNHTEQGDKEQKFALRWLEMVARQPGGEEVLAPYRESFTAFLESDNDLEVRQTAASLLARLEKEEPGVLEPHTDLLRELIQRDRDEEPQAVQYAAVALAALAKASPENVLPYHGRFGELLDTAEENSYIRRFSAKALAELAAAHPGEVSQYIDLLHHRLDDSDEIVRSECSRALSRIAASAEINKLAERLATTDCEDRSEFATSVISVLHDQKENNRLLAWAILDELANHNVDVVEPYTADLIYQVETGVSEVGSEYLGTLESIAIEAPETLHPHIETLAEYLSNGDPRIREKTATIFRELGSTYPDTIAQCEPLLIHLLEDRPEIRIQAGAALIQTEIDQGIREKIGRALITHECYEAANDKQLKLVVETIVDCELLLFFDRLHEHLNETHDSGIYDAIQEAIERLESVAIEQAEDHIDTAEDHIETAEEIHSRAEQTDQNPGDFTEAIDAYESAKAAYEEAISVVEKAGLEEHTADYKEEIEFIDSCIASCQLSRIKRRKRNYSNILQRNPAEAQSRFETLLEDIDALEESMTTAAIASSVATHREDVREGLWCAWLESTRQDILTVHDAASPRAIRKIKRIRSRLDEKEAPPIEPPEECIELETIDETLADARQAFITEQRETAQAQISELLSQFTVSGSTPAEATVIQQAELPVVDAESGDATISDWHVAPGDTVGMGEELVTIRTESTQYTLSMPVEGTVQELEVPADEGVAVGAVVMTFEATSGGIEGEALSNDGKLGDEPAKIELTVAASEPISTRELVCPNCAVEPESATVTRGMVCRECESGYLCVSGTVIEFGDD
jgi:hypothetical protein